MISVAGAITNLPGTQWSPESAFERQTTKKKWQQKGKTQQTKDRSQTTFVVRVAQRQFLATVQLEKKKATVAPFSVKKKIQKNQFSHDFFQSQDARMFREMMNLTNKATRKRLKSAHGILRIL